MEDYIYFMENREEILKSMLINDLLETKKITLDRNILLAISYQNKKIIPDIYSNTDDQDLAYSIFINKLKENNIDYDFTTDTNSIWGPIEYFDNCNCPASYYANYFQERNKYMNKKIKDITNEKGVSVLDLRDEILSFEKICIIY